MTFNLAARQKPKDISPNRITACSSPSSHNFQLDSLTAARSAGSQPVTALLQFALTKSGENMCQCAPPQKTAWKCFIFFPSSFFPQKRTSVGSKCLFDNIKHTHADSVFISHISSINNFNARTLLAIIAVYCCQLSPLRKKGSRWLIKLYDAAYSSD